MFPYKVNAFTINAFNKMFSVKQKYHFSVTKGFLYARIMLWLENGKRRTSFTFKLALIK